MSLNTRQHILANTIYLYLVVWNCMHTQDCTYSYPISLKYAAVSSIIKINNKGNIIQESKDI